MREVSVKLFPKRGDGRVKFGFSKTVFTSTRESAVVSKILWFHLEYYIRCRVALKAVNLYVAKQNV